MTVRKKVLHLISSTGLYGAETVILNLSKQMQQSSFLPIIGMIFEGKNGLPEIGNVARKLNIETVTFYSSNKFDFVCVRRIHNYIKNENIEIVHSHGYKPSILSYLPCKLLKKPLIITCHLWFNVSDSKLKFYHFIETLIMKKTQAVVGVSEKICDELIAVGIHPQKVHCIFNGIDLVNYRKYPISDTERVFAELGIQKDDYVIGAIGRLHEQKAFHYLIEAVSCLKLKSIKLKCLIFGEGPLREELEEKSRKLGLSENIKFPGFRDDVLNLLELIDVFVISSVDEGLPMVLLEAMAKKKAIISTPVGAIKSVLTHEKEALLYEVGDVGELAAQIDRLRQNEEMRNDMGNQAFRRFRESFSARKMALRYEDIYSAILS